MLRREALLSYSPATRYSIVFGEMGKKIVLETFYVNSFLCDPTCPLMDDTHKKCFFSRRSTKARVPSPLDLVVQNFFYSFFFAWKWSEIDWKLIKKISVKFKLCTTFFCRSMLTSTEHDMQFFLFIFLVFLRFLYFFKS